jgi:predicted CDP-diglyceride synthetase/phosphatidate cytidylyltransferase
MKSKVRFKPRELAVTLAVQVAVLVALLYLASHTNLPIPLLAALTLFSYMTFLTFRNYHSLDRSRRVGFLGVIISFAVLSILFALKYYVIELEISMYHIALIIFPPLLLCGYLQRKEQEKDKGSRNQS